MYPLQCGAMPVTMIYCFNNFHGIDTSDYLEYANIKREPLTTLKIQNLKRKAQTTKKS